MATFSTQILPMIIYSFYLNMSDITIIKRPVIETGRDRCHISQSDHAIVNIIESII